MNVTDHQPNTIAVREVECIYGECDHGRGNCPPPVTVEVCAHCLEAKRDDMEQYESAIPDSVYWPCKTVRKSRSWVVGEIEKARTDERFRAALLAKSMHLNEADRHYGQACHEVAAAIVAVRQSAPLAIREGEEPKDAETEGAWVCGQCGAESWAHGAPSQPAYLCEYRPVWQPGSASVVGVEE